MFSFDRTKLATDELLGTGKFGWVYPYRKDKNDRRWVVKHVYAKSFDNFLTIIQEIVLGFNCDHPSLIPIRGYHIQESRDTPGWNIYIKIPRMEATLKQVMEKHIAENKSIPEKDIVKYFYTLICGLEYLHERRIAHRDIKPTNILVDKQGKVKLADIGIAKFVADDETSYLVNDMGGTQLYAAPETYYNPQLKKKDLYKADVWSLGVVIAELCLLKSKLIESSRPIPDEEKEANIKKKLAELDGKYSDSLIGLISDLLRCNAEQRKTVEEVRRILESEYADVLSAQTERKESFELPKKDEGTSTAEGLAKDKEIQSESEDKGEGNTDQEKNKENLDKFEENKMAEPPLDEKIIENIKKELNEKWRDIFEFKPNEIFTIRKVDCKRITDQGIKSFFKEVEGKLKRKNIKNIQTLSLNLQGCKQITDQGMKELSNHLATNYKKLQQLSLNFYGCEQIRDLGIRELVTQIGTHAKDLQSLSLNFHSCRQITDKGVKELMLQISKNLKNLQHLALDFGLCNQITDQTKLLLKTTFESIPRVDLH